MKPASKLKTAFAAAALVAGLSACGQPDRDVEYILEDESVISEICNSGKPIIVIDAFSRREPDLGVRALTSQVDIDGDLRVDIGHGDLIEAIYRKNGQDIIAYGIHATEKGEINYVDVIIAMLDIIDKIESGEIERPAALSLSLANNYILQNLETSLGTELNLNPHNIRDKRNDVILQLLEGMKDPEKYGELRPLFDNFILVNKLETLGVPVIAAAGNDYAMDIVNLDALLGGISVGGLNIDGSEIAPYSNVNQLTRVYRPADIVARKVDGGIDITGDDLPEFPAAWSNAAFSLAEIYNGMPAIEALANSEMVVSEIGLDFAKKNYGQLKHTDSNTPFRIDDEHNLRFDPLGNGDPAQVKLIRGTSYAVPNICHADYIMR